MKKALSSLLILSHFFAINPVLAATTNSKSFSLEDGQQEMKASEYVMRRYPGERLMPIRILGGVQKPGTYYLPEGTDLITAISLSGGLATNADREKVRWSQWSTQKYETLDLALVMEKPKSFNPALGPNDVLMVEEKSQVIGSNTLLVLGAISSVVGIVIASVYISRGK